MLFRFLRGDGAITLHDVPATACEVPTIMVTIDLPEAHPVFGVFAKQRIYHRITLLLPRYMHGPYEVLFVEANAFASYRDLVNRYGCRR